MNEDELRDALHAIAGTPTHATTAPVSIAAHRARRRRIAAAGAVAAATAAVLGALALLGDDESRVRTVPADSTSTSTTATSITSTTALPGPTRAVAITDKGAVVVVDTASGSKRTLIGGGAGRGGVALSPDGGTVYYGEDQVGCETGDIYAVSIEGPPAPRRHVALGIRPAVSPDGTRLAFWARRNGGPTTCENTLVVRLLATGVEQRWVAPQNGYFELGFVDHLDWAPDGRRLVFGFQYEGMGSWILDTSKPGSLDDAQHVRGPAGGLPAWRRSDGRIAVVLECCTNPDAPEVPTRTVLVDPETGRYTTLFEADVQPQSMEFEPTGRYVLYVDKQGSLRVRDEAGGTRSLGSGYTEATW